MARSMWRGAIQFGLVTIPVKLYLATEPRGGLSFNLLHDEDLQRIMSRASGPKPERTLTHIRLEDRLEHDLAGRLHNAVTNCRDGCFILSLPAVACRHRILVGLVDVGCRI